MDAVFGWVATHGYGALFFLLTLGIVGLPVPDETLLVFTGYLISQGKLRMDGAVGAAVLGSWCGITLSYTIGRTLGLGVVHRFGKYVYLNDQRLNRVHAWFERAGHWALFGGYYIAGVRHFTAIVAGASKLEFRTFALFAWSGAVCWVVAFVTLGYYIGEDWRQIAELVHRSLGYASAVLIVVAAGYLLIRRSRSRKRAASKE
jgi:membrane protein DedA with SNARE-associated domain